MLSSSESGATATDSPISGKSVKNDPNSAETWSDLGVALEKAHRPEEALAPYRKALALEPGYAEAHYNLGNALQKLERHQEAIAQYENALALEPRHVQARNNLGNSLHKLKRDEEAAACFEQALSLQPDYAEAHYNLGNALYDLDRVAEAIARYEEAIALKPDYAEAHLNLGNALRALKRHDEALMRYRRAFELDPLQGDARASYVMLSRRVCDWTAFSEDETTLIEALSSRAIPILPFVVDDPADHLRGARQYIAGLKPEGLPARWDGPAYRHDKIRLGYLSADFHEHATAYLMAELFERHDRERFEVLAFSWGPDDGSAMRKRLERSFDRYLDVRRASDLDVARRIRELEIDVAVDLKGFTERARPSILAHRPSPIQVNYLGYPGTMGADFIDYIVVDPFVVPADQQPFFTEQLVHLPDCYQANDSQRRIAERTPSRAECGLPERGFVFACFNNTYKITPGFFDIWMRLLQAVPGSVLWLLRDNRWAAENLRREAAARGVSPDRLVFAERCPLPEHLARHRRADLFLDTLPCNAHTTASDALWAGLPVLTCAGRSFAARVAGSLLHAIGLPELVTATPADYEALALKLARSPDLLADIRRRLADNRLTTPLFDAGRFCRHLEAAYFEMHEIAQRGERPRALAIAPVPDDADVSGAGDPLRG